MRLRGDWGWEEMERCWTRFCWKRGLIVMDLRFVCAGGLVRVIEVRIGC